MSKKKSLKGTGVGPQGFLVEHVEKLVFAAFALVILLCIVGAIGHELYDKTPEQLATVLQEKQSVVSQNKPETFPALQPLEVREYGEWVKKGVGTDGKPLTAEEMQRRSWLAGTATGQPDEGIERYEKRREPEYLPVVDTKAVAKVITYAVAGDGKVAAGGGQGGGQQLGAVAQGGPANVGGAEADVLEGDAAGDPAGGDPGGTGGVGMGRETIRQAGVKAPSGSRSRGSFVAMITARVPREKQAELYLNKFDRAAHFRPSTDIPRYVTFEIQRADVTDGRQPTEKDWALGIHADENGNVVDPNQRGASFVYFVRHSLDLQKKWAIGYREVVDTSSAPHVVPLEEAKVVDEKGNERDLWKGFTAPLPPLLGEDWGKEAAGGFPLRSLKPGQAGAGDPGAAGDPAGAGDPGGDPGALGGAEVGAPAGGGDPAGAGGAFGDPAGADPEGAVEGGGSQVQTKAMSDILLRFFDFSISEGRRYRYRVKLLLKNPNYQLQAPMLTDPKLAEGQFRSSPWSEPTDVVSVSGFSELLAGPVNPARPESGRDDSATVLIRQRDAKTGAVITYPFSRIQRGQFVQLPSSPRNVYFLHPVTGQPTRLSDSPLHKGIKSYTFESNDLVLDMMGDRDKPGEMLILDSTGFLAVRQQLTEDSSTNFRSAWERLEELHRLLLGPATNPQDDAAADPAGADDANFDPFLKKRN